MPVLLSHPVVFLRFHVASRVCRVVFAAGFVALVSAFVLPTSAHGAEVTLVDGRVWEGVIVRETPDLVVLKTVGGEIEISRRGILKIDPKPTRLQRYEHKLAVLDKTSADQHYLLGLWCRRQRLVREAEYHLNYAVGLDVDHVGARRALGHVKYQDKWMPEKEAKESQGLRFYDGRWMTKEAAEQAESEALRTKLKAELERQVRALVKIVVNPRTERAGRRAREQLLAFRDPLAHDALLELMQHDAPELRVIGIRLAARLEIPTAADEMLRLALYDDDPDVRDAARDALKGRWNHVMLSETLKALKDPDRPAVRESAARVLAVAKDPVTINDLINALYVTYRVKRTGDEGAPRIPVGIVPVRQPVSDPAPGSVMNPPDAGGAGTPYRWRPLDAPDDPNLVFVVNYAALDALRAITQQNFGVNKRAWRKWWDDNRDKFTVPEETK